MTDGWVSDTRGNRNSVAYWGSEEAAQKALDSLIDCDYCTDCSDCSDCSGCSGCSDCSDCSGCSGCSRCSGCSGCSGCSRCSGCSDCSGCSGCSDCSGCSRCSGCSDCSRCKNVAYLIGKENIQAVVEPGAPARLGPPPIPVIPDIHKTIYAAASNPKALAMEDVHTCADTHCRGGWAITLAGEAGAELESFYNWELAAMLIYDASAPGFKINPARFYDNNKDALADMKRLAEGAAHNEVR